MPDFKQEVNMWMCNCIWLFMFMISPILRQCVEGLFVRCLGISMLSMDSSHQWELQRPGSPMSGHMLGQLYSRLQCYCHGSGFVIIISDTTRVLAHILPRICSLAKVGCWDKLSGIIHQSLENVFFYLSRWNVVACQLFRSLPFSISLIYIYKKIDMYISAC